MLFEYFPGGLRITVSIVYKSEVRRGEYWKSKFAQLRPDLDFRMWPDIGDPAKVKYLVTWLPPDNFQTVFPNLEAVFSVGAGVDHFDLQNFPTSLRLIRMLDPEIVQGMVEYIVLSVLAVHRQLPIYVSQQRKCQWQTQTWLPARERTVGIMGLGNIGATVASKLKPLGFKLAGWSRSEKSISDVVCFSGGGELDRFLNSTDILVCVLPLTEDTRGIINANLLAKLPKGASVINAGRGQHLVESDLLSAIDAEHISSAFIDVMESEPPKENHPFWLHPKIFMTPHIAGVTSFESGCRVLLENIQCLEDSKQVAGEVSLDSGY